MSGEVYSRAGLRTLSMLGMRGTFGKTLLELAEKDERIFGLTADLMSTSGMDRFRKAFPERFLNVGIAEQNMVGIAAGLACEGYVPFATTFANFAALRACEQIRHFLGYMNENVKIVGLSGGFAMGMFGITHYGMEDIAALRAVNGLSILSPSDGLSAAKAVHAAAMTESPVYLRLTGGMNLPIIYKEDFDFVIGKAVMLRSGGDCAGADGVGATAGDDKNGSVVDGKCADIDGGNNAGGNGAGSVVDCGGTGGSNGVGGVDVAIVATGAVVHAALGAADILAESGIRASVTDMHTINPLDTDMLDSFHALPLVATVEEHAVTGGLGGAVAEHYSGISNSPALLRIGVENGYSCAGDYTWLLDRHGLTAEKIAAKIKVKLEE